MTLEELRALEAAATPGPWVEGIEEDPETGETIGSLEVRGPNYVQTFHGEDNEVSDTVCVLGFSAHRRHKSNLLYIVSSRNHFAALLNGMEHAATILKHDGGPGSEDFDALKLHDARAALRETLKALEAIR